MKMKALTIAVAAAAMNFSTVAVAQDGFSFSGYARYGSAFSNSESKINVRKDERDDNGNLTGNDDFDSWDAKYIKAVGATQNTGRLGNEGNGGEFQFTQGFTGDNGSKWSVGVMLEHWGDDVGLKKFYATGTNIFASQPDAVVWAGRDFHGRLQLGLNDQFVLMNDGQGGGVKNLDVGFARLDMGFVGGTNGVNDNGNYAFVNRLHGISFGENTDLELHANYGFSDKNQEGQKDTDGYQLLAQLSTGYSSGFNKFIVKYSSNAKNGLIWGQDEDSSMAGFHWEGGYNVSDSVNIDYLYSFETHENANGVDHDANRDRDWHQIVVRPQKAWDDTHSTWVELGYDMVDFDNGDESTAWKATLSQNIAISSVPWGRPMLRFYVTTGEVEYQDQSQSTTTIGAMFESWW